MTFATELQRLATCYISHQGPGRVVVFEGTPGAGKTTTLRALAQLSESSVISELNHLASVPGLDLNADEAAADRWYLEAEVARQGVIRHLLQSQRLVFQDRNLVGTLAFVYARSMRAGCHSYIYRFLETVERIAKGCLVRPDVMIVFRVGLDTSFDRRKAFSHDSQYSLWFDRVFLDHYEHFYRHRLPRLTWFKCVTVDTTRLTQAAAMRVVIEVLQNRGISIIDDRDEGSLCLESKHSKT